MDPESNISSLKCHVSNLFSHGPYGIGSNTLLEEYIHMIHNLAAVTDIDTSGIHSFEELHKTLQNRDVKVRLI